MKRDYQALLQLKRQLDMRKNVKINLKFKFGLHMNSKSVEIMLTIRRKYKKGLAKTSPSHGQISYQAKINPNTNTISQRR